MKTTFVSQDIWPQLTRVARGSRRACAAAVAYFGAGASRLLPLPKGSRLVVDASERAVASGQTCPNDLIKLSRRGVAIYSVPNLHAKVFVLSKTAYIGSANASSRSASTLIEAAVRTTEPQTVRAARDFVQDNCLHELTPTFLKRLGKLYRPPKIHGRKRAAKPVVESSNRPTLPPLFIAQLHYEKWNERDQAQHDAGMAVAKKRRKHPRTFELDSFRQAGECSYEKGNVIIQVIEEGRGKLMVSPPGNVRYVRRRQEPRQRVSFIYLERPKRRWRNVYALGKTLGSDAKKRLRRDGRVRNAGFAQKLLNELSKGK